MSVNFILTKKELTERIEFLAKLFRILKLKYHLKLKIIYTYDNYTDGSIKTFSRTRYFKLKEINDLLVENEKGYPKIVQIKIADSKLDLVQEFHSKTENGKIINENYKKQCDDLYRKYLGDRNQILEEFTSDLDFLPYYFYED